MFFEICTAIALIVFIVISYFVVQVLRSVQRTLRHIDQCTQELDRKAQHLESTFKTIDNLGSICQIETLQLRQEHLERKLCSQENDYKEDLTHLIVASLKLGSKLLRRK